MGYGDALIAAGLAQDEYAKKPSRGPVLICDCNGKPRWRREWEGNPAIMPPNGPGASRAPRITLGGKCLPYHPWTPEVTFKARDYRGSIYLTRNELKHGMRVANRYGPFVLLEPTGKDRKNQNRFWHGWQALADLLRQRIDLPLLQLDRPQAVRLSGVHPVPHDNFRDACGVLKSATLAVMTEGGLAFGAAAVGTPAVVLWGGNSSVDTAGFPEHVNITDDDPRTPCFSSKPCQHCADAWQRVTPERVANAVGGLLRQVREQKTS